MINEWLEVMGNENHENENQKVENNFQKSFQRLSPDQKCLLDYIMHTSVFCHSILAFKVIALDKSTPFASHHNQVCHNPFSNKRFQKNLGS